ncbi:hypothetical protein GDO86_005116 [Hymenochirus boettgeri]|uniref:SEFIR domain-containing protein n=1 Tax=Hymenochirus boettgeri TaxID=247094 RepID=A0A8T2J0K2_9PIPI|nr:hypothetical protein GDO86_005116 [Hymenochirus boettgeri]
MQISTNQHLCVQLQFENQFPRQSMSNKEPWRFYFNNFEVEPSQRYEVTVQHLPVLVNSDTTNSKHKEISVPGCMDKQMKSTKSCCQQGNCWDPVINVEQVRDDMVVSFDARQDSCDYRIRIENSVIVQLNKPEEIVILHPVECAGRLNYTFPRLARRPLCWYKIQVWAVLPTCRTDCVRYTYTPLCTTTPEPPPPSFESVPEPISPPPPSVKKVWLVYSADSRLYLNVVIKLADFLRTTWGLEVILDRWHINNIGVVGVATWLTSQKREIEETDGTILFLCSRGTQEKWKARLNCEGYRVKLREDRSFLAGDQGDLFSCALSVIIPDIECGIFDRYVVAYFGDLSSVQDIPGLVEICPRYCLTENLQEVFFRIQRINQRQPGVQLTVPQNEAPGYKFLTDAVNLCRDWQENNPHWFEEECLPGTAIESDMETNRINDGFTKRMNPLVHYPDRSISLLNPVLAKPTSSLAVDPIINEGPSSLQVQPYLYEGETTFQTLQPILNSGVICKQELPFVDSEYLNAPEMDSSPQSDQGYLSLELLKEEQVRLLMQLPQAELLMAQEMDAGAESLGLKDAVMPQPSDQGYSTWNSEEDDDMEYLRAAQRRLLYQSGALS